MVSEKHLKWSLLAPVALLGLAITGIIIYILVPDTTMRTFLGITAMALIVLAGLAAFIAMLLTMIDAFTSKMDTARKAIWIIGVLLVGYLVAVLYYLLEARNRKD